MSTLLELLKRQMTEARQRMESSPVDGRYRDDEREIDEALRSMRVNRRALRERFLSRVGQHPAHADNAEHLFDMYCLQYVEKSKDPSYVFEFLFTEEDTYPDADLYCHINWSFEAKCRYCGESPLYWGETDAGWRLHDESGEEHDCPHFASRRNIFERRY